MRRIPWQVQPFREIHSVGERTREWIVDGHHFPAVSRKQISFLGISHAVEGFRFETTDWVCGQVLATIGGAGRVRVQGKWREATPGTVYLTPSHRPHAYEAIAGQEWQICWVTFVPPEVDTPLGGIDDAILVPGDPSPLHDAIQHLFRETVSTADPVLIEAWAQVVHLCAVRLAQTPSTQVPLWRLWHEVDAHLEKPWTLEELAELVSVSPEHLRRLCHKHLGRSPMEHVTHLRMQRAATLLRTNRYKIDAIAQMVGYADRFSFSTAFSRLTGKSPASYRASHAAETDAPARK